MRFLDSTEGIVVEVCGYTLGTVLAVVDDLVGRSGRTRVNFSEWGGVLDDLQGQLLVVDDDSQYVYGESARQRLLWRLVEVCRRLNVVIVIPHVREFRDHDPFVAGLHRATDVIVSANSRVAAYVMRDLRTGERCRVGRVE